MTSTATTTAEYALPDPPTDGITRVLFAPDANLLLVSSWDASVRLYDVSSASSASCKSTFEHKAAVLDCVFAHDASTIFSGGLDRSVKIPFVEFGWDSSMRVWDHRQASPLVSAHDQPGKCFAASLFSHRAVVGTAGRHVLVWDLRQLAEPEQRRESSLKYQTRSVACFTDGAGFALASTEGRVAMEYFDPAPEIQANKYAFKCHRATVRGVDTVYPVNALAFHPVFGTFASGGCDGLVNVWDGANKKRLCQFRKYPTSIASLAFSKDGTKLAIASSYTFEEGEKDHPLDEVFIRTITENEAKPKAKKK